jgi:lysophospholipase L1-like esterase
MANSWRTKTALLMLVAGAQPAMGSTLSLNLTEALADTKAKLAANQQADILVFGDSLSFSTDTTTYLTYFRSQMQSLYGNAGFGYQGSSVWTGAGFNRDWSGPIIGTDPDPHHSLDGLWESHQPVLGWPNQAYYYPNSPNTELQYVVQPNGGSFEIRRNKDGPLVATINTAAATSDVQTYSYQLQPGEEAFTIQPVGDGPFLILGQNTSDSAPGVRVHRAANGGYGVNNFLQRDWTFDKQVSLIHPDLVMIWLGINDSEYTPEGFHDDMHQFISRVQAAAPNSEIVLVGSYHSAGAYMGGLVAEMEQLASEEGLGFINIYQAAGTYDFFQQSTYLSDGIHFSEAGAGYLGNVLYNAFVTNGASLAQVRSTTWMTDANGSWSAASNWVGGASPNALDHTATFGPIINGPRVVTVDAPQTVGTINLSSWWGYTIAGSSTITLDVTSGLTAINVGSGSHIISAPIVANKDLIVRANEASGVSLTGALDTTGRTITKKGKGSARFEQIRAAGLHVDDGTVRIRVRPSANDPSGTSVLNAVTIGEEAVLDLGNNSLVIDYSGTAGTLVDDTRQHLEAKRLIASMAVPQQTGLGYADNSLLHKASFAGATVDDSSVLIGFTFLGDSDLDGDVDVADLGSLATHWQTAGPWTSGDFDYDGSVNVNDLGLLATNWQAGTSLASSESLEDAMARLGLPVSAVPEPGVFTALGVLLSGGLLKRQARVRT